MLFKNIYKSIASITRKIKSRPIQGKANPNPKLNPRMNFTSYSFYIPRMPVTTTVGMIREAFTSVGVIERVDFVPIDKKPGFEENMKFVVKSAFVHFTGLYRHGECIMNVIEQEGRSYAFYPFNNSERWLILPGKNKIQGTMMNNAQIVENCRFLERKVAEQSETISKLEAKLEGVHNAVYQLIGGLYNQRDQRIVIEHHLSSLFPENQRDIKSSEENKSKWTIWPTTRQGDENEARIERLEALTGNMLNFDEAELFEPEEDDEDLDEGLRNRKATGQHVIFC